MKPLSVGEVTPPNGQSAAVLDKRNAKIAPLASAQAGAVVVLRLKESGRAGCPSASLVVIGE